MDNRSNIDDSLLAYRIREGDMEAFNCLYDRYKSKIYYFSLRYLGNKIEAEELVQIIFISVWEHRKLIDESLSIKNYLYKSVVNYIYNHFKREAIRNRYIDKELQKPKQPDTQIYDQIYYHDLESRLTAVISRLPQRQKMIISLSRLGGLSTVEISKKMCLSVRTVENHIYRALKVLKKTFGTESEIYFF